MGKSFSLNGTKRVSVFFFSIVTFNKLKCLVLVRKKKRSKTKKAKLQHKHDESSNRRSFRDVTVLNTFPGILSFVNWLFFYFLEEGRKSFKISKRLDEHIFYLISKDWSNHNIFFLNSFWTNYKNERFRIDFLLGFNWIFFFYL